MVYYLQLECNNETAVPPESILKFDRKIAVSLDADGTENFRLNEDGSVYMFKPGVYAVFWYVAGMTGFSTDGQFYQLKKIILDDDGNNPHWGVPVGSTNHIKVSSSPGFAIVNVTPYEPNGRAAIALFNTADAEIELTFFTPKAGILIYGMDFTSIENRLSLIDQDINNIFDQLQVIQNFVQLSDTKTFYSPNPLDGVGVSVIYSGYTYNFWGIGSLNHQQPLTAGQTYYLLTNAQFDTLQLYKGQTTISTLWIEEPNGNVISLPLRFDGSGIYFRPITNLDLDAATMFKFTQALILTGPPSA